MPTPPPILHTDSESQPEWLSDYKAGDPFPREAFFSSRILYYPGSETDGCPIRYFGIPRVIHCYVYADSLFSKETVLEHLENTDHERHPRGYRVLESREITEKELTPTEWTTHLQPPPRENQFTRNRPPEGRFALWAVMERLENFDDAHGPERWALLHIGGDGFATFDALFCQTNRIPLPHAVLLQDHGRGGNWSQFGGEESPLWKLISESGKMPPEWVLCGENTDIWPGYKFMAKHTEDDETRILGRTFFRRNLFRSKATTYLNKSGPTGPKVRP